MKKILLAALLALPWMTISCVDSHSNMGPATSFETAYSLALQGKYQDTAEYFTDDILNYLKTNPDMTLEKLWAERLNNGAIKGVKIAERDTNEKNCDIKFLYMSVEGMMEGEDTMVYEKGMWKFDKIKRVR